MEHLQEDIFLGRFIDPEGISRIGRFYPTFSTESEETTAYTVVPIIGDIFGEFEELSKGVSFDQKDIRLLAPLQPSKIIGIGSNYKKHILEMGRKTPKVPKVFLKSPTSIIGPNEPIQIPPHTERVHHEAELGVVIGKTGTYISETDALEYVFGYTCVNDVTARDFQKEDGTFARAKGFNTFCPIGPWIKKTKRWENRKVKCYVNQKLRQDGNSSDMLFSVQKLISFISHIYTLYPGDIIATGTPEGVGTLQNGDVVDVVVEGIGSLSNSVMNRFDRPISYLQTNN